MILVPIIEKYSSFTKGEQQIADYILNNPEEALSKTASELASISRTYELGAFPERSATMVILT